MSFEMRSNRSVFRVAQADDDRDTNISMDGISYPEPLILNVVLDLAHVSFMCSMCYDLGDRQCGSSWCFLSSWVRTDA